MTTQQLTANFSINDVAYFVIFATANLYAVKIIDVYIKTVDGQSTIIIYLGWIKILLFRQFHKIKFLRLLKLRQV